MISQNFPPAPEDREEILSAINPERAAIYHMVRGILDDFEEVAPWEDLYYPPTEVEEFLRIQSDLLRVIDAIPYRVWGMTIKLLEAAVRRLLESLPAGTVDQEVRHAVAALMDGKALEEASGVAKQAAREALQVLPDQFVSGALKQMIRWLVDRHESDAAELSGEVFDEAVESFPEEVLDAPSKELIGNLQFYFDGIHTMTGGDVEKLIVQINLFETATEGEMPSAQDRVFTCEISADLKGKYSSAIMGAASNLVAEGNWNGAEVEPILFPEKAEEFERNELLVETLREVLESIKKVPKEVPLVEIAATWDKAHRVDRYALSHLYGFLGSVGKLMKESSRRALYSGDYHQIQLRESRLSGRVNELNMLHNKTWEVLQQGDPSIQDCYPQMVDKAIQLATVLDVELLKKMIGGDMVRLILNIVSIEGEKRRTGEIRLGEDHEIDFSLPETEPLRAKVPRRLKSLIPLLHDEDLQTFLELLLGSVQKRASFAVKRRQEEAKAGQEAQARADEEAQARERKEAAARAAAMPHPETNDVLQVEDLSALDLEILPEPELSPLPGEDTEEAAAAAKKKDEETAEKLEALERLQSMLREFLAPANPHRKAFDLVFRLLSSKGMIPPAMLRSMLPYIEDMTDLLVPQLAAVSAQGAIPITFQGELTQYCRALTRRDLTPREMKTEVLSQMEGLLRLLSDLEAETQDMIDACASGGGVSADLLDF